ncbi:MAG: GntR family transcriptional regulator [Sneathiella sp.]
MRNLQSNVAYSKLKSHIILGALKPGTEYTEIELADKYNIGRAAIRVALIRLGEIGLVTAIPRRGFTIAPITARAVRDLFETRLVVEPRTAFLATGKVDIDHLKSLNIALPSEANAKSKLMFLEKNNAFHMYIAEATGNKRLAKLVGSILDEMSRLINVGLFGMGSSGMKRDSHHTTQEDHHEKLIEAFAINDAEKAEVISREHIEHSYMLAKERILEGDFSITL